MLTERFWSKVIRRTDSDCWLWTAAKTSSGYGVFYITPVGMRRAHRLAYEDAFGPIPDGLEACHKCDNPGCVNPSHIFVGTHLENMRDMAAKGRTNNEGKAKGTKHPLARLTDDKVRHILSRAHSPAAYAKLYGVSTVTIYKIWSRKTWAHVE